MPMDYYSSQLKASPCLENLPVDILIQIQKHLDGRDLIVLRKSCKKLHAVTQRRTVWLNAVRRMCRRHGVFAPSFPLEDMSITELEHASLCPSRLSSLIHNDIPLRSFVTRILEPRTPTDSEGDLCCSSVFLIPGGRFLVVDSAHGICLWDLGIHGGKAPKFRPVAVIPDVMLLCCGPTQDGLGIILISRRTRHRNPNRTLRAHEIYPCMNRPHLTLLGSIQYAQQATHVGGRPALYSDLLVFENSPGYIVAWNTRLDTAIAWRYDHQYIYDMSIYEGSVILIQESELSVWDIPPLQPLLEGVCEVVDQTPRYAIVHSFPSHEELMGSCVLSPFSSIDPLISFVMLGYKDEECSMLCYTLRSINPSRDPILPMVFPIKMGMVPKLLTDTSSSVSSDDYSEPLQYCDDELCLVSISNRGIVISLIAPPTSLDGPSSSKNAVLFDMFEGRDQISWSFCAASGRLVVVDDDIIRIMDFLVPPPS
ncbi:uncharacterized protein LACBIDRAFT_306762 [Laccaria bicolor S238N-H82]|uniref:Predicted protein n=1 Tax=Laccaria bicolor (strain S238N-H82 / ATCC MYA-4686) TaxID=486041 RepID=B0DNM6_LACBS|nr:uncharacterized protein LACBIDRAFT_306762 [Laccaria bicolor S238N-H82]EDR03747.1 predicted protein [Laccaria bicolor S238N-H82]|eukprot:XP_001885600.1 predicted protein [Laccaria bicolor S238N-H82]